MGIFKAYDIRGMYPDEINEELSRAIGNATAQVLGKRRLVVGRDMRPAAEPCTQALIEGITDAGVDVVDIGLVSTPASYFAIGHYAFPGGVMCTASHNPPGYTGFKVSREEVKPVGSETGLHEIEELVSDKRYARAPRRGAVTTLDIWKNYEEHVLSFAEGIRPFRIAVDAGNGMVGKSGPPVFARLPGTFIGLYFELDGTFPNHEANPLKAENVRDLQRKVLEEKADLGAAFDGDGDRCAFIDEKGNMVGCDLVTALIGREFLSHEKGAAIVYDLRSSRATPETIRSAGGKPVRERVGHAFIKNTMREHNAPFGGELSGHYYFRDNFFADSGLIALVKMLNVLSSEGKTLSELVTPLLRYSATGEINFEVKDKDAKIQELARTFHDGKIDWLDGITVEYPDWWFNVRKSNTEPVLRLTLEAGTPQLRDKKKAELVKILST
ncbi:MAG: phosphomannomutase/phosphoglucomutase [Planctomycetota bacterium]